MKKLWKERISRKKADIFLWISLMFYMGMAYVCATALSTENVQSVLWKDTVAVGTLFFLGGISAIISGMFTEQDVIGVAEAVEELSEEEWNRIWKLLETLDC